MFRFSLFFSSYKVSYILLFILVLLQLVDACLFFRNWLKTAKSVCPSEEAKAIRLDAIEQEISLLEKVLSGDQRIGFCHNDLQYGNIMIDEETKAITIIVSLFYSVVDTIHEYVTSVSNIEITSLLLCKSSTGNILTILSLCYFN